MTTLDRDGIKALIPHREPFLLIDRITELEPGVRAVGEHDFDGTSGTSPATSQGIRSCRA